MNSIIIEYYYIISDRKRNNQCKPQSHTRVLKLRHVERRFSFFLFTFILFSWTFSQTFLPHFGSLLPCTLFAVLFHFRRFLPPLSLTQCLSCCAFHLAIFILGHCRQANIVFWQSHFSADIFIPKQKSPSPHHHIPTLSAPHYTVK